MDAHSIVLHIRITPEMLEQLERIAAREDRPVSSQARRILADWLKRNDNRSK